MADAALFPLRVPKPDHVPDALVYDIDLKDDPGFLAGPHERILRLFAEAPPIFWTPRLGGHWVMLGYEANFEAGRDWASFTSQQVPPEQLQAMLAARPAGSPHIPMSVPITLDPPLHTKYRLPLNSSFSPKGVAALTAGIRALAVELIERVKPQGACEFMHAVAEPLPVQVFLKFMGLPVEQLAEFRALAVKFLAHIDDGPQATIGTSLEIVGAMRPTFLARKDDPKDDLISLLWATKIDGEPMTLELMEDYGILLFIGGLDTVMNGIGFAARRLASDQALQQRLRDDPKLIPEAVEEMLRCYSFAVPVRLAAKDLVFQGVEMKQGERVWLLLAGADLDPAHWPEPGRFDLKRDDKVHIAFGTGPHRCLGSHLARVELQILYEELLSRLPPFRLDPEKSPTFHGGHVIGLDSLDLVWSNSV
jgi:cytochrome P450